MAVTDIRPTGNGTYTAGWGYAGPGSSSLWGAVSDADPVSYSSDYTHAAFLAGTSPYSKLSFSHAGIPANPASVVSRLRIGVTLWGLDYFDQDITVSGLIRTAGVDRTATLGTLSASGGGVAIGTVIGDGPTKADGTPWTIAEVNAIEFGINSISWVGVATYAPAVSSIWLEATYDPIPGQIERIREIGSRRLLIQRYGRDILEVTVPIEFASSDLLSEIAVSWPNAPTATGAGWGIKGYERRVFRLMRSEIDLNKMVVKLRLRDLRRTLVNLWDVGRVTSVTNVQCNGVARLDLGTGARTFDRNSFKYIDSPTEEKILGISTDIEAYDGNGFLLEKTVTNIVGNGGFKNGLTGWTTATNGVGALVSTSTSDLWWDSTLVATSCTLYAPNGGANYARVSRNTANSVSANTYFTVSIRHKDAGDGTMVVRLQRNSDAKYWDNATLNWVAAPATDVPVTFSSTKANWRSAAIPIGTSSSTLNVMVMKSGGASNPQTNYVYNVQVENARYATSPILTNTTSAARTADDLTYTDTSTAYHWHPSHGTLSLHARFHWNSTDLESGDTKYIWHGTYGASEIRIWYQNGTLTFRRTYSGINYDATYATAITRDTWYQLAFRWTGSAGELGLTAGTQSVFVNKVKGTDVVGPSSPSHTYPGTIRVGRSSSASSTYMDGWIKNLRLTPLVHTDTEIGQL
jgi:hypothetical protein